MTRLTVDEYFIAVATVVSERSTCLHRKQGAVLVRDRLVVSAGYNGSPPGQPHCIDVGWCAKEAGQPCRAEGCHAESNCLVFAARMGMRTVGAVMYTIYSPCRTCANLLSVAGIGEVVYKHVYSGFPEGLEYIPSLGINLRRVS